MESSNPAPCSLGKGCISINLHIQPRASRNRITGIHGNALRIALTSPPVDGEANRACREFLSELFSVPKSSVTIKSGEASRHKRVIVIDEKPERIRDIVMSFAGQEKDAPPETGE